MRRSAVDRYVNATRDATGLRQAGIWSASQPPFAWVTTGASSCWSVFRAITGSSPLLQVVQRVLQVGQLLSPAI